MIVLDTHVWLWWISDPGRPPHAARSAIDAGPRIGISTLSAWEVALLVARGRIELDREVSTWVRQAVSRDRVEPVAPSVAAEAARLDGETSLGDPVDRLIYATARALRARLVTRDRALHGFDAELALW